MQVGNRTRRKELEGLQERAHRMKAVHISSAEVSPALVTPLCPLLSNTHSSSSSSPGTSAA